MTTTLWTAAALADATGGRLDGAFREDGGRADRPGDAAGISGLTLDSRDAGPGDLFIAIRAARDGHAFVGAALSAGAAGALVDHRPEGLPADAPLLMVEDSFRGLQALGVAGRGRAADLSAIAVTGSVGKTSTKDMLATMLSGQGATHAAEMSLNNHWGVPLTLARMPAATRFAVIEIGMSAPGEIAPLSRMARPHAALITTVAPVHVEAFADGIAGVAAEKAEIVAGLAPGGVAVLPADAPEIDRLVARARAAGAEIRLFGASGAAARLISVTAEEDGVAVEAEVLGARTAFRIGAPGRHFAANALGALLAVEAAGGDWRDAAARLADWRAIVGRGETATLSLPGGPALLVDESYNANPASLRAAIATFADGPSPAGRRHAFLTDMLELGPDGRRMHAEIAAAPGIEAIDQVHTAGPLMRALHDALPADRRGAHAKDAAALAEIAVAVVKAGDAAMVKGSKGSGAKRVADRLRALGASGDA